MNEYDINDLLDDNLLSCAWIDFLGRHKIFIKLGKNNITDNIQDKFKALEEIVT